MCNFRIRELTLTNYRNFEQQTFKLKQGVSVLAGKNGSGKTAVLEAAVVIMGAYLASFEKYVPSRSVYNLSAVVAKRDAHKKLLPSRQYSVLTGRRYYPVSMQGSLYCSMGTGIVQSTFQKNDSQKRPDDKIIQKKLCIY